MPACERKHCPVCLGDVEASLVESWREFRIWQCSACELQFADPMRYSYDMYSDAYGNPDNQLAQDTGFASHVAEGDRLAKLPDVTPFLNPVERAALRWVCAQFQRGALIVDLGCGPGRFLMALTQRGFMAYGLDVAKPPIEMLRRHGFSVSQGSIDVYPTSRRDPEAIVCFEVLEHVPSPVRFLQAMRERFPNAWVVLSVPVPLSKRCRLIGGFKLEADYPPNHLTRWTGKCLKKAFEKSGYEVDISHVRVRGDDLSFSFGLGFGRLLSRLDRAIGQLLFRQSASASASTEGNPNEGLGSPRALLTLLRRVQRYALVPLVLSLRLAGKSGYAYLAIARSKEERPDW